MQAEVADVYVLQLWRPDLGAWWDLREFDDFQEPELFRLRIKDSFPLDQSRVICRSGLDDAPALPGALPGRSPRAAP